MRGHFYPGQSKEVESDKSQVPATCTLLPLCVVSVYECGPWCGCDRARCQNRLVQRGIRVRLQVFQTDSCGWGVRCRDDLDRGTFVCTYAGQVASVVCESVAVAKMWTNVVKCVQVLSCRGSRVPPGPRPRSCRGQTSHLMMKYR